MASLVAAFFVGPGSALAVTDIDNSRYIIRPTCLVNLRYPKIADYYLTRLAVPLWTALYAGVTVIIYGTTFSSRAVFVAIGFLLSLDHPLFCFNPKRNSLTSFQALVRSLWMLITRPARWFIAIPLRFLLVVTP